MPRIKANIMALATIPAICPPFNPPSPSFCAVCVLLGEVLEEEGEESVLVLVASWFVLVLVVISLTAMVPLLQSGGGSTQVSFA
jgi:hypothetical protein